MPMRGCGIAGSSWLSDCWSRGGAFVAGRRAISTRARKRRSPRSHPRSRNGDPMIEPPPPTLRLRIDAEALAHNWRALDAMSRPGRAGAAIKADCYGLGTDRCLPLLRDAGARDFFVAHWQEVAPALRHIPTTQLSVLHGPLNEEEASYARAAGVRPVINSLHQA